MLIERKRLNNMSIDRHLDCYVTWEEFRDIFLPIVNNGIVTKEDLSRWFNIFDFNHRRKIDKEQ